MAAVAEVVLAAVEEAVLAAVEEAVMAAAVKKPHFCCTDRCHAPARHRCCPSRPSAVRTVRRCEYACKPRQGGSGRLRPDSA